MANGVQRPQQAPQPPAWSRFITLLLLAFMIFLGFQLVRGEGAGEISYTEFRQRVEQGRVVEVTLEGRQVRGKLETGDGGTERFETRLPVLSGEKLLDYLQAHDVSVRAEQAGPAWWGRVLLGFLPWLLILGVIFYFSWRMQQQAQQSRGGLFNIGRSTARRFRSDRPQTRFDDVAGAENAKKDLGEVIEYLRRPDHYRVLGAKLPRGVLMVGPPGTGKTLLARAVAGEAGVPFFSISGSEFIEMFVGVGASRVRDMFRTARREAPAIIFIDELDAIGRSRGTGVGGGHDEREQTLNQILSEMDGFSPGETVIVMAATNRPDVLDPALLRPGRFDRKVSMERPHREAREQILQLHTRGMPLTGDVDIAALARRTVGFSGADLENLANEAALLAGREDRDRISADHFDRARDKILMGAEREQRLGDAERERVAWHESGHAMAARLFPRADNPEKVTVIPRGQTLGATEQTPDEDRYNITFGEAHDRIAVMLAGRVAERLMFGEVSSGAEQDIEQATRLARRMVARWGMDEDIGPVSFSGTRDEVFLGREISREREFSDETAHRVDQRVRALILEIEREVEEALAEKRHRLEKLAGALLEEETLEAERIEALIDGGSVRPGRKGSG